jgi:cysteine desulfurase family protein (TIGR01976 family)
MSRNVRRDFPALDRKHEGSPVAYFDGPGGTQVPRQVVDAMADYLYHHNANTHWNYPTSAETDAMLDAARVALADFVNGDATEIAFGLNMTTLTFHLARGLSARWAKGDEVVVTELDHHGNIAPWTRLASERGIVIKTVRLDPARGVLDWADLEQAITARTKLLAIGAASNALGTVTDVAAAARLAHDQGALVFVDAVHYAPHVLVDVKALGCDFLACSAYKFYGPHVGVLWGKRDLIASVDIPKLIPAPEAPPERLETGTQNHEGIIGAAAAVDYLAELGDGAARRERLVAAYALLHEQASALLARMWNGLSAIPGVHMYGCQPGEARTPTVAFTVDGVVSDDVARSLARKAVFVSNGDFYATTVIERLGHAADGVVRAGCACYTTADEVDRLIAGVADIARGGG